MNKKSTDNRATKYMGAIKVFFGIATFLFLLSFLIGESWLPSEQEEVFLPTPVFETSWQQVLDNKERIPAEVPGKLEAEYGEVVTLVTTLPQEIKNGTTICFRPVWQDVEVYIGDELRRVYNTEETRPFGTNSAFRYVFVELGEEDAGKEVTYCFSSESKYAGYMNEVLLADRASIWFQFMQDSGARLLICIFMIIVSLFGFSICVVMRIVYRRMPPLNYLCWALFFGAFWMLSETEIRQVLFKNVSFLANYSYWSLMLLVFPMLIFIDEMQKGYYRKYFIFPITYSAAVLVVGTVLQLSDIVQFVQMVHLVHAGTCFAVLAILLTMTIDTVKQRIGSYLLVAIGVYGTMIAVVLEIILYYMNSRVWLGTVSVFALLILFVLALINTVLELLQGEKERQQAVAAKDAQAKFLANISHEIRTPINAVIGMNEMVLRESDSEAVQQYAYNIQSASNMLLGLVNDVLDFTKIESGQLELVGQTYTFATMMQDELTMLYARAEGKPLTVQVDVDSQLPVKLYGDELRIKQILMNLLSNAVKYTKEGQITLKVFFQWIDTENIELCFSVTDTGIGIKKEDLPKLFERFKRLEMRKNQSIEGTGLGLAIVKQLVELMQGSIKVDSEYGKGSTFIVRIPQKVVDKSTIGNFDRLLQEQKREKVEEKGLFTAPDAAILVVDDNDMNRMLMEELLKRTLMQVDTAAGGKECLALTKKRKYDLILMDHMMPELDGVETLQMIRAERSNPNRNATVIALTANATAGSRKQYLEYGFDDYFAKPVRANKLETMLLTYLPQELIHMNEQDETQEDLLTIRRDTGLSYCMDSEELYMQILETFCKQAREYLPKLELAFREENWEQYIMITHSLKGNALNIGAVNFSELSLKHELAGKEKDEAYIRKEFQVYLATLEALIQKIENSEV